MASPWHPVTDVTPTIDNRVTVGVDRNGRIKTTRAEFAWRDVNGTWFGKYEGSEKSWPLPFTPTHWRLP